MKGIHGLILAIGLGIAGALFNFAYLAKSSRGVEKVAFVGAKETIASGERLAADKLTPVEIPALWVGNLDKSAVRWEARNSVVDRNVSRTLEGGSLLLRSHLETPPAQLKFAQDLAPGVEEVARSVPIDTRKAVPSLVQPGDFVSFVVTTTRPDFPTLADDNPGRIEPGKNEPAPKSDPAPKTDPAAKTDPAKGAAPPETKVVPLVTPRRAPPGDTIELIGRFRVLSIGNRLGNADVMHAAKIPQTQENVMVIAVLVENGKMEPKAARLQRILDQSNSRPLDYVLHSPAQKQNP